MFVDKQCIYYRKPNEQTIIDPHMILKQMLCFVLQKLSLISLANVFLGVFFFICTGIEGFEFMTSTATSYQGITEMFLPNYHLGAPI